MFGAEVKCVQRPSRIQSAVGWAPIEPLGSLLHEAPIRGWPGLNTYVNSSRISSWPIFIPV